MKISAFPVIILLLCTLSCADKSVIAADPEDKYEAMECIDPMADLVKVKESGDKTGSDQYIVELKGLVEVNQAGDVYIVVNPESKSRKSYLVTGKLKPQVSAMKGSVVSVKCCYLEKNRWSGTVRVYEILE